MRKKTKKKRKRKNVFALEKRIYVPLSNVVSAIIRLRHTSFQIVLAGDYAVISNLPLKSRFSKIRVYPDREVKYMDQLGTVLHEGNARSIGRIKKDILTWQTRSEASGNDDGDALDSRKIGALGPPVKGGFFRDQEIAARRRKKKPKR